MLRVNYEDQIFGNRKIIRNYCQKSDWQKIGRTPPNEISKYRLSKCLVCGAIMPALINGLIKSPPKRCSFCSNINHKGDFPSKTNSWALYEDYAVLNILHSGKITQTYISPEDYEKVSSRKWRTSQKKNKIYIITGSGKNQIYLHRFILGEIEIPDGYEVDHIDGNSINNMRSNLRVVPRIDNIINSKVRIDNEIGIRGISKCGRHKYNTDFCYKKTRFYFRHWDSVEEAVWCRKVAEDYFNINTIKNNPLAEQFYNLSENKKKEIENHTLERIDYYLNNGKPPV